MAFIWIIILDKVLSMYTMWLVKGVYELIARLFFSLSKVILLDQARPKLNVVTF